MRALILAGGEGTRLRPLTSTVPKPVLPLAGRPMIGYMIDWLARHGTEDVVIACGFGAARVREVLGEGGDGAPRLRYVEEPEPLGTAGAVAFAAELLGDRFLVLNGDLLTDIDLGALVELHERRGARATIGLYPVEDPSAYGLVRREPGGRILEFLEKPSAGEIEAGEIDAGEINAGAYVLEASVLELIPGGRAVSIEREVFPRLVGEGLYGMRCEGYWLDIGTPERYLQASWDILERRVETRVGELLGDDLRLVEQGASLAADARIEPPALVEAGAAIEAGARIGPRAVVGRDCRIGPGARLERAVLHEGCRIGPGAAVRDAILGPGVTVAEGARVEDGAVIAEGATVEAATV